MKKYLTIVAILFMAISFSKGQYISLRNNDVRQIANGDTIRYYITPSINYIHSTNPLYLKVSTNTVRVTNDSVNFNKPLFLYKKLIANDTIQVGVNTDSCYIIQEAGTGFHLTKGTYGTPGYSNIALYKVGIFSSLILETANKSITFDENPMSNQISIGGNTVFYDSSKFAHSGWYNSKAFAAFKYTGSTQNTYILPATSGTTGQALTTTTGTNQLNWTTITSTPAWNLTGNSGISYPTNYIGTNDNSSLYLKSNGYEVAKADSSSHGLFIKNKISINGAGWFSPLAVIADNNNTGFTTRYLSNAVDGTWNKNRSTYIQATDTSSVNIMATPLGKILLNVMGLGNKVFTIDSLGYIGINLLSTQTPATYLNIQTGQTTTHGLLIDGYSTTTTDYPAFIFKRSTNNTLGTITANATGTIIGRIDAYSPNSSNAYTIYNRSIQFVQTGAAGTQGALMNIIFAGQPTASSASMVNHFIFCANGRLSLAGQSTNGATTAPTYSISLNGLQDQTFGIERTTSAGSGGGLTISCGAGKSGTADQNGGKMAIAPGLTTGTGMSSVRIQRYSRASSTGTSDNIIKDVFLIPSDKPISNNTPTTIFTVPFPADSATYGNSINGVVHYQVSVLGSNGRQSESGEMSFTGVEYLGTVTASTSILPDHEKESLSSGTLATTLTVTYAADVWTIQITCNSSLTSPVLKLDYIDIQGNGGATITQN